MAEKAVVLLSGGLDSTTALYCAHRAGYELYALSFLYGQLHDRESGNLERDTTPNTYVPARNMVFLSIAASIAESVGARYIYIGVSEADYSGYVDCRAAFIEAMQRAINEGTERCLTGGVPIEICAPFLHKTKAEEIALGVSLGVDYAHTWSCYRGGEHPCGVCDSCLLRARAFATVGVEDPLL